MRKTEIFRIIFEACKGSINIDTERIVRETVKLLILHIDAYLQDVVATDREIQYFALGCILSLLKNQITSGEQGFMLNTSENESGALIKSKRR